MITLRRAADRGTFDHGWLQTAHTFSFAGYHDAAHMQFSSLRVLNEDVVAPGEGFGMHGHSDMEILTWVLRGALRHEDSMGHTEVLRPGEVQVMSAGTGVMHSEVNPSPNEPVHLLQIWIVPGKRSLVPSYAQRPVDRSKMRGALLAIAAPSGQPAVVEIHQDAVVHATELARGQRLAVPLRTGRRAWIQVARGSFDLDGTALRAGDGAAITDATTFTLTGASDTPAEALVFDLT